MRISQNTHVRNPAASLYITGPNFLLPDIIPASQNTAQLTSDGYPIDTSPYLLTFVIDSSVGYFDAQSFSYAPTSPYTGTSFVLCNLVTQTTPTAGVNNYLMYYVLNGVCGNGIPRTQFVQFTYGLYYWDNNKVKHVLQGATGTALAAASGGKIKPMDNPPGIQNGGQP
jgi:hypothetical protein